MRTFIAVLLTGLSWPALAALSIFACTPEWASLAQEIGGDRVNVYSATSALQDPHHIEARPSLIARARRADLVFCNGAELETGWLPLVLGQSGNALVQPGQRGYLEAASAAHLLEVPGRVDRAMGDVHAAGNPHLHLDPRNVALVAKALAARLIVLDAQGASVYAGREAAFQKRWGDASARWERQARPLQGLPLVVHHKNLSYLIAWLGMREVAALEPKPGLPPSAAHLSGLLASLKRTPAKAVVRAAYNDPRAADWLGQQAGVPAIALAYTVGGNARATDLFTLFDDTIASLLAVTQ